MDEVIYLEGYESYEAWDDDNPYPVGSEHYYTWQLGWETAQLEDNQ